jgi:hypothetical protein
MELGLITFLLILGGYLVSLLYLNAKVNPGKNRLPKNLVPMGRSVNHVGILILGVIILTILIFAVGVIFFHDEWLPR